MKLFTVLLSPTYSFFSVMSKYGCQHFVLNLNLCFSHTHTKWQVKTPVSLELLASLHWLPCPVTLSFRQDKICVLIQMKDNKAVAVIRKWKRYDFNMLSLTTRVPQQPYRHEGACSVKCFLLSLTHSATGIVRYHKATHHSNKTERQT